MRTGAAAAHAGYYHETAFYGSDDEFLAIVRPFLVDGVDAREPTFVACGARNTELLRGGLDAARRERVRFVDAGYARPADTIARWRSTLGELVAGGVAQIRIVGDVPLPALGTTSWDGWARYEAVVNSAYDDFPLWGMCPYDTRTTPAAVLDDVAATHPFVASPDGSHRPNDRFREPRSFLEIRRGDEPDALEAGPPLVGLSEPSPAAARDAVARIGAGAGLGPRAVDDLMLAASEAVSNAMRHGRPPTRFRIWAGADRVVVAVTDHGSGPSDPFVGLVPRQPRGQGLGVGMWVIHRLCDEVSMRVDDDGFTIRMIARTSHRPGRHS